MSLPTDIADAVAAELNAAPEGTFAQAFTAVRAYVPANDVRDLKDLRVLVVPRSREDAVETRRLARVDVAVDVGVQRRVDPADNAAVDALSDLAEQVLRYLRGRRLAAQEAARWVGAANEPIFYPDHLLEQRVFTSVVRVTYRVMEE